MKKLIAVFLLLCTMGAQGWSQKTIKDANAQQRNLKNFTGIRVSHGIDLYLTQGNEEAVAVSASETSYRDKIITEVVDGVLKIYYEKENGGWSWTDGWRNRKLKAYVSVKTLEKLQASGGSDVFCEGMINAATLSIGISGGSDLKGQFSCTEIKLSASGGSDASLSGKTERIKIDASGGSDVNAYQLSTDYCNIVSSGGSDVNITVHKSIIANASGGSDVYYKGSPTETKTSKSGSSDIKKVNYNTPF